MGMELESDESFWLERELIERETYIGEDLIPVAYEVLEFLESAAAPTMFVNVRGKNYLIERREYV